MLDPRSLADRRDEIVRSCERRGVRADVDGAVRAQQAATSVQTELNGLNQQRNEHQAAGKRKLSDEERAAHVATGRALKEQVAEAEGRLATAREALDAALHELPNFLHPSVPDGGEEDFVLVRTVGEPTRFDFEPQDHLAIAERLELLDFEAGARVAGQKWYYLKNDAVLLELALQRFALDVLLEEGFTAAPHARRGAPQDGRRDRPSRRAGRRPRSTRSRATDLDLVGTAEITLGALYADAILDEDALPAQARGHLALLPHGGRARPDARARASTGCTSSPRWRCSCSHAARGLGRDARGPAAHRGEASSRTSSSRTA